MLSQSLGSFRVLVGTLVLLGMGSCYTPAAPPSVAAFFFKKEARSVQFVFHLVTPTLSAADEKEFELALDLHARGEPAAAPTLRQTIKSFSVNRVAPRTPVRDIASGEVSFDSSLARVEFRIPLDRFPYSDSFLARLSTGQVKLTLPSQLEFARSFRLIHDAHLNHLSPSGNQVQHQNQLTIPVVFFDWVAGPDTHPMRAIERMERDFNAIWKTCGIAIRIESYFWLEEESRPRFEDVFSGGISNETLAAARKVRQLAALPSFKGKILALQVPALAERAAKLSDRTPAHKIHGGYAHPLARVPDPLLQSEASALGLQYVTAGNFTDSSCLAHEIGHLLGLEHRDPFEHPDHLMIFTNEFRYQNLDRFTLVAEQDCVVARNTAERILRAGREAP